MKDLSGARVVAVHAHPDDEAIWTGGALAHLARRGADVTVVTCTLGEEGEVIGETYQELVADHGDQLGGFRIAELRASLTALGVQGVHLGAPGRYRDSGMAGTPAAANPRAFVNATTRAVADLVDILVRVRPHLVITYGPDGGYGHPDHIQAHTITHAAVAAVGDTAPVQRIAWSVTDTGYLNRGLDALSRIPEGWRRANDGEIASLDGFDVAVELTDQDYSAKLTAMKAHATQLWIADATASLTNPHTATAATTDPQAAASVFALSNLIAQPLGTTEHYRIGAGTVPAGGTDLMEGLEW